MQIPETLKTTTFGEEAMKLGFAAAIGAVVIMAVGFNWFGYGFGWKLDSTAEQMARSTATTAVAEALAPICVAAFMGRADSAEQLAVLKGKSSWDRAGTINAAVSIPGTESLSSGTANACAEALLKLEADKRA